MTQADIRGYRLINQQIASTKCLTPQEIVSSLVAMQAQEFAWAKWAIGLRLPESKEADIDKAFNEGAILRTHLLRPTWHFVTPADIRWLLALTSPRVHGVNAYYYRKLELDKAILNRSSDILAKELQGGKQLTRTALNSILKRKKIVASGLRLSYLFMSAELEGIICSGARQGKQFTYALLDERATGGKILNRKEALAELTKRYFTSREPATIQDFAYWSGLTFKEIREGLAMLPRHFDRERVDGQEYIFVPAKLKSNSTMRGQTTFLVPDYDEYVMSYKNRSALSDPAASLNAKGNPTYKHWLAINGVIGGTWEQTKKGKNLVVETAPFNPHLLDKTKRVAIQKAVKLYLAFMNDKFEK